VFTIGDENLNEKYSDYSIINTNYHIGNGVVASVSVLGPERMDYAKIASALKYISDELTKYNKEK
jgi:transcriptional regulator of heat shock response